MRSFVLAAIVALVFPALVFAEEPAKVIFPATPAGRIVAAYLEAFNGDDTGGLRAFLEANLSPGAIAQRPVEQRLKGLRQMKNDIGALVPMKIVEAREDAITVVAQGAKGSWLEISFAFEKDAPDKMIGARFKMLDEPPDLNEPTTPLTEAELLAEIDSLVDGLVATDDFSGVVLVARGEAPLFWKAYGFASKEYGVSNRLDTRFNLGSINKIDHASRDRAARGEGSAPPRRHDREITSRLSEQGGRRKSHDSPAPRYDLRHRRFLRREIRRDAEGQDSRPRRLSSALRGRAASFRAGHGQQVFERRVRRARTHRREGERHELFRLRAGEYLPDRRDGEYGSLHGGYARREPRKRLHAHLGRHGAPERATAQQHLYAPCPRELRWGRLFHGGRSSEAGFRPEGGQLVCARDRRDVRGEHGLRRRRPGHQRLRRNDRHDRLHGRRSLELRPSGGDRRRARRSDACSSG